jgi:hypothetical protein
VRRTFSIPPTKVPDGRPDREKEERNPERNVYVWGRSGDPDVGNREIKSVVGCHATGSISSGFGSSERVKEIRPVCKPDGACIREQV